MAARASTLDATVTVATLESVVKRYGKTEALRGLDLTLRRGEILALLGPNGAGKTTAVRLLLGLISPSRAACAYSDETRARLAVDTQREGGGSHGRSVVEAVAQLGVDLEGIVPVDAAEGQAVVREQVAIGDVERRDGHGEVVRQLPARCQIELR